MHASPKFNTTQNDQTTNMKKIILLLIAFNLSLFTLTAQVWKPVGNGTSFVVSAVDSLMGKLYVGGYRVNSGRIASWDGSAWDTTTMGEPNYSVNCLITYNNKLVVGGGFDTINGTYRSDVAMWDGSTWSSLGSGISPYNSWVSAMVIYNGNLVVAGGFDSAGGIPAHNIAMWNGTTWDSLGSGLPGVPGIDPTFVAALAVYNGNLYATGYFGMPKAAHPYSTYIAEWNGTSWDSIQSNNTLLDPWVDQGGGNALTVYNNTLIIGGYFPYGFILEWNGAHLYSYIPQTDNVITALTVHNNILYAGGNFTHAGTTAANFIASWNGTNWNALGSGTNSWIYALGSYNDNLYAGGAFTAPGNSIAEWDVTTGLNNITTNDESISVYPNPSNGLFTFQSSVESHKSSVLEVYNMLGEKVYSKQLTTDNSQFTIDLSNNTSGIYLYRISSEDGTLNATGKLIIE